MMREYARVGPKFWNGKTGRALRARGSEALIVGLYLMTSPHSNMLGLFYQPLLYMAHETGLGIEGASKGLAHAIDVGFCSYDEASEVVWIHEMAKYQVSPGLKANDKRCSGIQKDYDALPDNAFIGSFFDRYQKAFHLSNRREFEHSDEGPWQAPSKPLRSKEKEKEKEKEKDISSEHLTDSEQLSEFAIQLVDSTEYRVPANLVAEWEKAYPAVDVRQELREMRTWCLANKQKRKTRRGIEAFIVRWMGKAQDTPGRANASARQEDSFV